MSVINRETGKKITGAKAPPLKYLKEWLEKNPAFDIDGKWAHVVAAKVRVISCRSFEEQDQCMIEKSCMCRI